MSTSFTKPSNSAPREATLADAFWGGVAIAAGILIAVALTGNLSAASGFASAALMQIGHWLGASPSTDAQVYWHMARAAGVVAYLLLWGSVAWGLVVTNRLLQGVVKPLLTFELHQFLSILALAFAGFHAFILLGDRYIEFGVADLLIPFRSPYEPVWVGLGILAFYLTAILSASFYLKSRIGHTVWRRLHYASFLVWVMATLHGLMAGTDSRTPLIQVLYLSATASIGFLTIYRILVAKIKGARLPA